MVAHRNNKNTEGLRIAILVEDGFELVELVEPKKAMEQAGMKPVIISPGKNQVKAWDHDRWADSFDVDVRLEDADPDDFDGLLVPGGVMSPDRLRMNPQAVQFVRAFFEDGKPVASICHGPWMLVEADVVADRRVTSYPSLRTDLENAGAHWVDEECVVDEGLVTSRKPADLPAFNRKMVEEFAEGIHVGQRPK